MKHACERTKYSTNHKILVFCLFSFVFLGATYYIIDDRKEVRERVWITGIIAWYVTLGIAIALVFKKARSGYLIAGIIAWSTLVFYLVDNWYTVFHASIIATRPDSFMTVRNFIGAGIAVLAILSSHNSFHKVHVHG